MTALYGSLTLVCCVGYAATENAICVPMACVFLALFDDSYSILEERQ